MALTVAVTERGQFGNKLMNRGTIAFDTSYPTGGESLTANQLGLRVVDSVHFEVEEGFKFDYVYGSALVLAFYADYSTGTDGALIEVADMTDISSVGGVRFTATGV